MRPRRSAEGTTVNKDNIEPPAARPANLKQRFDALDENLKLDPKERRHAELRHDQLGKALIAAGIAKRTRLQGSFARKTMRPPLKDVDKVIELTDSLAAQLKRAGGPKEALTMIQDVVADLFPGSTFEVKKHALGIVLPGETFDFDAVPAINDGDSNAWIRIADTDDDGWEPSNTYQLIETVANHNQRCDGLFVHQVRMVKEACHNAGIDLPGLHLESFTYMAVTAAMPHPHAVAATLAVAVTALQGSYTEPTGVDIISNRLKPAQRAEALAKMQRLSSRAQDAIAAATAGDEHEASVIWGEVFGPKFPAPKQPTALLRQLNAGHTLTAAGHVSNSRSTRTRPWRP